MDSLVPLMHHDPDRSWITNRDPHHPKRMHPKPEGMSQCIASLTPQPREASGKQSIIAIKSYRIKDYCPIFFSVRGTKEIGDFSKQTPNSTTLVKPQF